MSHCATTVTGQGGQPLETGQEIFHATCAPVSLCHTVQHLSHSQSASLSPGRSVTLLQSHLVPEMCRYHCVTASWCHRITVLLCHRATLSLCHCATAPLCPCLLQVLDALGEAVPCVQYKSWIGYFPGGTKFTFTADAQAYRDEVLRVGGQVRVCPPHSGQGEDVPWLLTLSRRSLL